ncbi:zinc finger protein [Macleaya cordata]|uniref:Zinc finger protein n=1 Tax=Macleaya cordata TaxID=56857 RepID=A0A200Q0C1_MACCD|nr:zinc finger protein [Macleaya cordata]
MGGVSRFLMLLRTPSSLLYNCSSAFRLARRSRVSLAWISSAQNRQFSSNSNNLSGFDYEQLHTQTSRVNRDDFYSDSSSGFSLNSSRVLNHFPEWSNLVENLRYGGYFDRQSSSVQLDDAFNTVENIPEEFVRAVSACLSFARDHPNLLGSLSRKDIEVVVKAGTPCLFKRAGDSVSRMKSFLGFTGINGLEFERAHTVDLMYFLLSYACNPVAASDGNNFSDREHVESSVRNLLGELANASRTVRYLDLSGSMSTQFPDRYGQTPRPLGQNIEMKRGDWICPNRCSFMNFARNVKCLECDEARPKGLLTGGEWECPQCDFFNYGRNAVCLRCDCKRPVEASFGSSGPTFDGGYSFGRNADDSNIKSRLAANEEKAERWFSKVSQLDSGSDLSSAIADEDFPEIMPLRKGVNRFVVSTRKTPLERRLADAQYRRNLGNDGTLEENDIQAEDRMDPAKTSNLSINQRLDRILGRTSSVSESDNNLNCAREKTGGENTDDCSSFSSSRAPQNRENDGSSSSYSPFVPLPTDTFAKSQNSKMEEEQVAHKYNLVAAKVDELTGYSDSRNADSSKSGGNNSLLFGKSNNQTESKEDKEQAEKSARWSKKVSELHNVTDLASAISDEDFPDIMPMRKGENRFVVSKKKDRSLTPPLHKRRVSMEQTDSANFVPFVPFPPDYFTKNNKDPETGTSMDNLNNGTSAASAAPEMQHVPEKLEEHKARVFERGADGNSAKRLENQLYSRESWNSGFSTQGMEEKVDCVYGAPSRNSTLKPDDLQSSKRESWNSGSSQETFGVKNLAGNSGQQPENSWNRGFSGKSLEGSAVKELDPLDMSEEAKAERWFRRVAQIKDISELSNIPDEDFPEIMPMRKGVNRFVVSKRKTPLERRLTSPQYRRNLPIVTHDPMKKDNDSS